MLKINDRWYVDSDSMQFILYERTIAKKGKRAGEEIFTAKAYCGNLIQLKNWLINQEILDNIGLLRNLTEIGKLSNTIDSTLRKIGE